MKTHGELETMVVEADVAYFKAALCKIPEEIHNKIRIISIMAKS
jgi:hypothetical protein